MNNKNRYDTTTRWLHWTIFLLFVGLLSSAELRGFLAKDSTLRSSLMTLHKSLGIIVMAFVIFRIYWRVAGANRVHFQDPPNWQNTAAGWVHLALYVVMVVMPVSGYLMSAFGGRPVTLFSLVPVPILVSPDPNSANLAHTIHVTLATAIYYILGIHILAALWHRYVYKDGVLQRML